MKIDKNKARTLRLVLDEILKDAKAKLAAAGVAAQVAPNCTFTESRVTFKLDFAAVGETGAAVSREAGDFKHYAKSIGFEPEHLGAKFTINGIVYEIAGYKAKARRNPIMGRRVSDGVMFVFSEITVLDALGLYEVRVAKTSLLEVRPPAEIPIAGVLPSKVPLQSTATDPKRGSN